MVGRVWGGWSSGDGVEGVRGEGRKGWDLRCFVWTFLCGRDGFFCQCHAHVDFIACREYR